MAPNGGRNIKWMTAVSVWLFLGMTAAFVTTKVSLLWILRLYKYEQIHPATWYLLIVVLLEVPLLCHVIHLVWNTPFINGDRPPMPRKSRIVLGMLGSVSESVAGAVFASEISYVLPEPVLLLLPAAVYTLHLITASSHNIKQKTQVAQQLQNNSAVATTQSINVTTDNSLKTKGRRPLQNCLCILMSCYVLWAPAGVGALLYAWSDFNMTLGACLVLPPSLLILSATWSPHLQAAVVRVKVKGQDGCRRNPSLSLVYTLFRICTVPLTLYLIMFFKIDAFRLDPEGFVHHVTDDVSDARVWLPVLLASVFGLVSVMIGGVTSKVAMNSSGMRIPALVTPFVSLGAATLLWNDMESSAFWELSGSDVYTWTASGMALVAWLILFLVPGIPIMKTPRELLRPFSENFFAFTWRPFFLEHHLMLNSLVDDSTSGAADSNYVREKLRKLNNEVGSGKVQDKIRENLARMKRVFICTTMYRETESEMRRYLNSLKRAFTSDKLLNVDLETHIFLDNCIEENLHINTYARQLLYLLTKVLNVPPASLVRHATPYGCQVSCRCVSGYMLYVHCKNGREFKPKKRWSQVMYMNYILKHRATRPLTAALPPQPPSISLPPSYFPTATGGWKDNLDSKDNCGKYASEVDKEKPSKIWFSSEEILPPATSEALHRMLTDTQPKITNLSTAHCCGTKIAADRHHQHDHQHEETGSESAICSSHDAGSDRWREAYAVSMESTTSCNCSDTDDDSDMFSFRGLARLTCNRNDLYGKDSQQTMSKWKETQVVGSTVCSRQATVLGVGSCRILTPNAIPDGRGDDHVQTPLCNVRQAEAGFYAGHGASVNLWHNFNSQREEHHPAPHAAATLALEKAGSGSDDFYILATDADTEFSGRSVRALVDQCEADHSLGAVCGRTVPVGGLKPIVWYQKFEYAKDFWLVKSSQNVIGSVTCCPGCFSLYRGSAVRDVMDTFSRPSASAYDTLVKDHGEDRWLCTLLMQQGWKLEYADSCHNSTHCPETCGEFLRQRRRWVLSELSNMLLIFQGLGNLIKGNATFSAVFILSLLHMFVWVLLSPSTTLVVTCVGFHILFHAPMIYSAPVAYCILMAYFVVCVTQSRHTQRVVTQVIIVLMVGVMVAVSAGFVEYVVDSLRKDVATGHVEFKPYFLVLVLIAGTMYAALLHANEGPTLIYGLAYAVLFPAMFLALPVYSIANMVDTSWGTRELAGSKACCASVLEDPDDLHDNDAEQFKFSTDDLPTMSSGSVEQMEEQRFWNRLKETVLGCNVNCGESERVLRRGLFKLRNRCVLTLFVLNSVWYAILTSVYVFVNSDVVCYTIASLFSFSLVVQLVGMTSYKLDEFLKRYIVKKMKSPESFYWVKEKS